MDLLRHLMSKRIWEAPRLWTGFLKCIRVSVPDSLPVVLELPKAQILDALKHHADLKEPLVSYAVTHLTEIHPDAKEALSIGDEDAEEL